MTNRLQTVWIVYYYWFRRQFTNTKVCTRYIITPSRIHQWLLEEDISKCKICLKSIAFLVLDLESGLEINDKFSEK